MRTLEHKLKPDYKRTEPEGMVRDGVFLVKKCRWCGGPTRATSNNGIVGPGFREWNRVCRACGKVQ